MGIKNYKAMTPGQRGMSTIDYSCLDRVEPLKSKLSTRSKTGGRNNLGRITVRHRGGGAKRKYREIDFKRNKKDMKAKVEYLEYDPNRTAFIARLVYSDGKREYIIAPSELKKNDVIISSDKADIKPGNAMPIKNIPLGSVIHNIEKSPGGGAQFARSAGSSCQIAGKSSKNKGDKTVTYVQVKMPSGELRMFQGDCLASIGVVSNLDNSNKKLGKAGKKRYLGIRPTVRGVAMNPVDHPHGGGEGRTSGGRHPVSPWAVPTKGYKTRNNRRTDKLIVKRRKK